MNISLDNYYDYSINEIKNISDLELQKEILTRIQDDLKIYTNTSIYANVYDEDISICEMLETIEEYYQEHTSTYYSSGDIVFFYPVYTLVKSKNLRTSDLTGQYIYPGSQYYIYHFIIWNKTKGETKVLDRKLTICLDEVDLLPYDLASFEYFEQCLNNAYVNDNEQYYNYLAELGFESFPLRRLGKSNE